MRKLRLTVLSVVVGARQLDLGLIHRIRYTTPQSSLSDSTDTTSDTCVDWDKSIGNRSLSDLAINFVCAFHLTILQISAFFLFPNFQKGRLLYIHPVGRSVGWLVGGLVDVTIDFFQYIETLEHFINTVPLNTKQYQVKMN